MVTPPPCEEGDQLLPILHWIDAFDLSRKKKNLGRDFSDGVLVAEIVSQTRFSTLVNLHNYSPVQSTKGKRENWETLNRKVLQKMGINLPAKQINNLATVQSGAIEEFLLKLHAVVIREGGQSDSTLLLH
jgi:hypothetical protein